MRPRISDTCRPVSRRTAGVPGSLLVCVNKPGRVRLTEADDCA
jgi:hypothetical protein